jgi:hypothetical protein
VIRELNGHFPRPISLTEAFPNQCRWVLYEPRSLLICGAQVVSGRPYCLMHLQLSIDGKRVQA